MSSSNIQVHLKPATVTLTMPYEHAQKIVALLQPWYQYDRQAPPNQFSNSKLHLTDLAHALENAGVEPIRNYSLKLTWLDGQAPTSSP